MARCSKTSHLQYSLKYICLWSKYEEIVNTRLMYSILNGIAFVIGHIIAYYIVLITHKLTEKLAIDVMTTLYIQFKLQLCQ